MISNCIRIFVCLSVRYKKIQKRETLDPVELVLLIGQGILGTGANGKVEKETKDFVNILQQFFWGGRIGY